MAEMRAWVVLLLSLGVSAVGPARASPKAECIKASDLGQDLRDQGRLVEAKERFTACGAESCPKVVRVQCRVWAEEVERRLPTVLLRVRDGAGADVLKAFGTLDGAPLAQGLDGRSLALGRGAHTFRFEADGLEPAELKVMAREGEKDRWLDVTLRVLLSDEAPAPVMPPPPARSPVPAPQPAPPGVSGAFPTVAVVSVLGGLAVLGGVSFGVFGADAKARVDHLRATCAPDCGIDAVDVAKRQATIANLSLVVGAVAAAVAVALLLWRPPWAGRVASGPMAWIVGSTRLGVGGSFGASIRAAPESE